MVAVGASVTAADINSTSAQLVRMVFSALTSVQQFKEGCLDTLTDADLIMLGYTAGEVALLRSAVGDLDQLRDLWDGGATLAVAKDFRVFAKRLLGTGLY